jgi:hypothetical protein
MIEKLWKETKKTNRVLTAVNVMAVIISLLTLYVYGHLGKPAEDNAGLPTGIPNSEPYSVITKVNLYTDPVNGCQYITPDDRAPFTPRLDIDGRQICGAQNEIK